MSNLDDFTKEDLYNLMNNYKKERNSLRNNLRDINTHIKYLGNYSSTTDSIKTERLYESPEFNFEDERRPEYPENWHKGNARLEVPIFDILFLYAATNDYVVSKNILYHINEIFKLSEPKNDEPKTLDYFGSHVSNKIED